MYLQEQSAYLRAVEVIRNSFQHRDISEINLDSFSEEQRKLFNTMLTGAASQYFNPATPVNTHPHTFSCILICSHLFPYASIQSHTISYVSIHAHLFSRNFMCSHTFSCMFIHSHACSYILIHSHACSYILIHSHTFSYTIACLCLTLSFLAWNHVVHSLVERETLLKLRTAVSIINILQFNIEIK